MVLVDFSNDSVRTSLEVAEALGKDLWGVRLDTAHTIVDRSLHGQAGELDLRGVNPELVRLVRKALDMAGHRDVKIVVSGGFDAERIREFERQKVPVDMYGVGSSLIRGENDFTADVVVVDGKPAQRSGASSCRTTAWMSWCRGSHEAWTQFAPVTNVGNAG